MPAPASAERRPTRKQLGAWATPPDLVDLVVDRTVDAALVRRAGGRAVRVLDPACGDGRFLRAAAARIDALGGTADVIGVDVDRTAVRAATEHLADLPRVAVREADALRAGLDHGEFDVVVGNPPFVSQMAAATTRGAAGRFGAGVYGDVAADFLALAVRAATPDRGRIGLVLPQSVLASRDAGAVRADVDRVASMVWSWWSPRRHFDADVVVCALGFERAAAPVPADWTRPVLDALGVPHLPPLRTSGTVGHRARAAANFRDEYYGLVPAVADDVDGPPLVTSGAIDPGRCHWGERPVRFAGRSLRAPRVDLSRLDARMRRWADGVLRPKVLVANQTRVLEAVADDRGEWIPGVPVTRLVPVDRGPSVSELAAVLTSPVVTACAWAAAAGTGLSARALRVGPAVLSSLPWPAGDLAPAVEALRRGDVVACGRAVDVAFGTPDEDRVAWWVGAGAGRMAS